MSSQQQAFKLTTFAPLLGIIAILYPVSLFDYLLFHSLTELASVAVAFGIFMLAWNSRKIMKNQYLIFLGISYLFVGLFDLVHTLAYKGMGVFPEYGANLPTQLWIAARYLESLSLLAAPLSARIKFRPSLLLFFFSLLSVILLGLIFTGIFPVCFREASGLTPFKIISEYLICAILLLAFVVLYKKRDSFDPRIFRLISASIMFTIASELAFTFYISVFGTSNLIGHFFKLIAFYLIYKAIIETGLREPYNLLFLDLKKNEEMLRQSTDRYHSLFKHMINGFAYQRIVVDEENRPVDYVFLEINNAFEQLTGLRRESVLGKRVTEVLPGIRDSSVDWIGMFGKVALSGEELRTEQYAAPLGRWYNVSAYCPAQGHFAVIFEDITARKNNQFRLQSLYNTSQQVLAAKSSEEMLQKIVDAARELTGSRISTSGHGFREGNFRVGATSGAEQTSPCPPGALIAVEKGGIFMDLLERNTTLRLTEKELYEHPGWRGLPEAHIPLRGLLGASLTGRDNVPRGLIMVTDKKDGDFTEEDEMILRQLASLASLGLQHIEAREMADERAHEAEEGRRKLDKLSKELTRSNEDLEQFTAVVSHDLQEPLRTVSGFVQLLGRRYQDSLDEKALLFISHAVDGIVRMQRLIDDLLAFSRVGSRGRRLQEIDLEKVLEQAMLNLQHAIDDSGATFVRDRLPVVCADEVQMTQLFQNLIGNAIKFRGDQKPVIRISLEEQRGEWVIRVSDNGIGIEPQHFERIFSIFQRLHRKEEYPGTGVGLAFCKKIVERHGGRIRVESSLGKGACFIFSLPRNNVADG